MPEHNRINPINQHDNLQTLMARRNFLRASGAGVGTAALASLFSHDSVSLAAKVKRRYSGHTFRQPHHPPRAKDMSFTW
jgi:hypothetical protein